MRCFFLEIFITLNLLPVCLPAYSQSDKPVELGSVLWERELNKSLERAAREQKPVLILFQEVPGCMTCRRYGEIVLTHPLIVEVIETYFIPLAIFNNHPGEDARVLSLFDEPGWNNPVVRIIDSEKKDIVPRLNGNYSPGGLTETIIHALRKTDIPVPDYLLLLSRELSGWESGVEKLTLGMYCFWTGEKELGSMPGVLYTEAGFMRGREVVNVYFDPRRTTIKDLLKGARNVSCADYLFTDQSDIAPSVKDIFDNEQILQTGHFRIDPDHKYYLNRSAFKSIPMTPYQSTLANSLYSKGEDPGIVFSPRQMNLIEKAHYSTRIDQMDPNLSPGWNTVWRLFAYRIRAYE